MSQANGEAKPMPWKRQNMLGPETEMIDLPEGIERKTWKVPFQEKETRKLAGFTKKKTSEDKN